MEKEIIDISPDNFEDVDKLPVKEDNLWINQDFDLIEPVDKETNFITSTNLEATKIKKQNLIISSKGLLSKLAAKSKSSIENLEEEINNATIEDNPNELEMGKQESRDTTFSNFKDKQHKKEKEWLVKMFGKIYNNGQKLLKRFVGVGLLICSISFLLCLLSITIVGIGCAGMGIGILGPFIVYEQITILGIITLVAGIILGIGLLLVFIPTINYLIKFSIHLLKFCFDYPKGDTK